MKTKERNYGIDLLRLVFMYMVCLLHTLGQGGVLKNSGGGTLEWKVYYLLEIIAYCAVDGFAFISGYMATDRPQKYEKLANMWFQAFFYSFVLTLIFTIAGINESWGKKDIIKSVFLVTSNQFWYFTAYVALFFAIPILNRYIFTVDMETAKKALIIIVVMFSCMGFLTDTFRTTMGYSALWLMVLYCIGALAKRVELFERKKTSTLIILYVLCIGLTWVLRVFFGFRKLVTYISPTILLSGIILAVLFSRLRLKGTIISKLSPLAFGVYLFQINTVIWEKVIVTAHKFVLNQNIAVGVICALAFAFVIFASGLTVEFIRSKLAKWFKIPSLSRKIVQLIDRVLVKLVVVLK